MLKKITAIFIAFSLIPCVSYAVSTSAESCILIGADTRQILYNNNGYEKMGMASTTKIMTAIVALENCDSNKIVTVSENAQNQEGSSIYLRAGDEIKLLDLIYGLMLNSGNDAAVAIAEGVAKDVNSFVSMMNEKARKIGCKNTHFKNPSGLADPEHFSTAYDLALIMAYAMENEEFSKIVSTKEYQIENENSITYLRNHNKLLWQTSTCIGGKTGFTKANGRCLVSVAEKDGKRVIAVTLNDRDDWNDHKNLYEYGFGKLKKVRIISKNDILLTKTIRGTKVNLLADKNVEGFLKNGEKKKLSCKIYLEESVNSNISFGSRIGWADIFVDKFKVDTIPLKSGQEVKTDTLSKIRNNLKYYKEFILLKKRT